MTWKSVFACIQDEGQTPFISLSGSSVLSATAAGVVVSDLVVLFSAESWAFSIISTAGSRFAVSGTNLVTGAVATDWAVTTSHEIIIQADSTSGPSRRINRTVTIVVVKVDVVLAAIDITWRAGFELGVLPENTPTGDLSNPVGTALADITPTPAGTYDWEIVFDPDDKVVLDADDTTIIRLKNPLDFETKAAHTFIVRGTSPGVGSLDKIVDVTVTDVNEPPTSILINWRAGFLTGLIPEDTQMGIELADLAAIDPDAGDTFTFSKGSDPDNKISVVGTTIVLDGTLFYTLGAQHTFSIIVTDAAGLTYEQSLTLTVGQVAGDDSYTTALLTFDAWKTGTGTVPTAVRKYNIDKFFKKLRRSGWLNQLDFLFPVFLGATQAQSNTDIFQLGVITPQNNPTYVASGYYQGNNVDSYVDLGIDPSTGPDMRMEQDNILLGVVMVSDSLDGGYDMGCANNRGRIRATAAQGIAGSAGQTGLASKTSIGGIVPSVVVVINKDNTQSLWRNGEQFDSDPSFPVGLPDALVGLRTGTGGSILWSDRQGACWLGGAVPSTFLASKMRELSSIFKEALRDVAAEVIVVDPPAPSLYPDADLTAVSLDADVTYTRTGEEPYINSSGVYAKAAANTWPIDHDPVSPYAVRGRRIVPLKSRTKFGPTRGTYVGAGHEWTGVGGATLAVDAGYTTFFNDTLGATISFGTGANLINRSVLSPTYAVDPKLPCRVALIVKPTAGWTDKLLRVSLKPSSGSGIFWADFDLTNGVVHAVAKAGVISTTAGAYIAPVNAAFVAATAELQKILVDATGEQFQLGDRSVAAGAQLQPNPQQTTVNSAYKLRSVFQTSPGIAYDAKCEVLSDGSLRLQVWGQPSTAGTLTQVRLELVTIAGAAAVSGDTTARVDDIVLVAQTDEPPFFGTAASPLGTPSFGIDDDPLIPLWDIGSTDHLGREWYTRDVAAVAGQVPHSWPLEHDWDINSWVGDAISVNNALYIAPLTVQWLKRLRIRPAPEFEPLVNPRGYALTGNITETVQVPNVAPFTVALKESPGDEAHLTITNPAGTPFTAVLQKAQITFHSSKASTPSVSSWLRVKLTTPSGEIWKEHVKVPESAPYTCFLDRTPADITAVEVLTMPTTWHQETSAGLTRVTTVSAANHFSVLPATLTFPDGGVERVLRYRAKWAYMPAIEPTGGAGFGETAITAKGAGVGQIPTAPANGIWRVSPTLTGSFESMVRRWQTDNWSLIGHGQITAGRGGGIQIGGAPDLIRPAGKPENYILSDWNFFAGINPPPRPTDFACAFCPAVPLELNVAASIFEVGKSLKSSTGAFGIVAPGSTGNTLMAYQTATAKNEIPGSPADTSARFAAGQTITQVGSNPVIGATIVSFTPPTSATNFGYVLDPALGVYGGGYTSRRAFSNLQGHNFKIRKSTFGWGSDECASFWNHIFGGTSEWAFEDNLVGESSFNPRDPMGRGLRLSHAFGSLFGTHRDHDYHKMVNGVIRRCIFDSHTQRSPTIASIQGGHIYNNLAHNWTSNGMISQSSDIKYPQRQVLSFEGNLLAPGPNTGAAALAKALVFINNAGLSVPYPNDEACTYVSGNYRTPNVPLGTYDFASDVEITPALVFALNASDQRQFVRERPFITTYESDIMPTSSAGERKELYDELMANSGCPNSVHTDRIKARIALNQSGIKTLFPDSDWPT